MTGLVVFALLIGIIVGSYLLNGWVLFKLWEWFMVPFGLPSLSISWAIGIAIVVGFLTAHDIPKQETEEDIARVLVTLLLRPLISVFVGWIVYSCMR